ncbi:MAG: response regulator [Hyphomicrobium sp.]|nr:MAG: response regulator [Hyphomicrobium sp.]
MAIVTVCDTYKCALVIDDDPIHCELMSAFLRSQGIARVLTAADGLAAKQQFAAHALEIDLLLCDLNMPELDGVEFQTHLSGLGVKCPLIIVSAANPSVVRAAERLAAGHGLNVKGAMRKPIDYQALGALLSAGAHAA